MIVAAREFWSKGWQPIPIARGQKAPHLSGWPNLRLSEDQVASHFQNDDINIGIVLGEASGHLVDIDLDSPEALAVADAFLPPSDRTHGRKSRPRSHRWYVSAPSPQPKRFDDIDGTPLVELRSTGQQTVVPPSVHPCGEPLRWERDGNPAQVEPGDLYRAVARVASASLLARHWPKKGQRHKAALALAGTLLRGGLGEEEAMVFISTVARAADDDEVKSRMADVRSTARRLAIKRPATGGSRLAELLGKGVLTRLSKWLALSTPGENDGNDTQPYRIEAGCICIERIKDQELVRTPLCNFVAQVTEEILLDDGVENARAFVLEGKLVSGEVLPPARVPASRFGGMNWIPEQWGLGAIVSAGLSRRDQLREAIQRLSQNPRRRRVFAHTGWRQVDGEWLYLTASGAVGRDGFEVDLGPELSRFSLPRLPENQREAMQISLRLLDVAPLTVSAPLFAAIYRAPLASVLPLDLSIWLVGPTGSLKSTIAALFGSHFGSFSETSLPGSWSSTANQLERRAFILKDAPFIIDDYAPSGIDARELEMKAMRLLRSQGNLSGRGRLRADLSERPANPPRGIIIGTGEQQPPGQSILARTPLMELERASVDLDKLTEAQRNSSRLPHAMAGYILWLAPQMATLPKVLCEVFEGTRHRATVAGEHLRVPNALAHLWIGIDCAMRYGVDVGAIDEMEAADLRTRCWNALESLGDRQARSVEGERPSRRFLSVLTTLLAQGLIVLLDKDSPSGTNYGNTLVVGWEDEGFLYVIPDAAYQSVVRFCRESGEPFPVRSDRLLRDLNKEGLSDCSEGRNTATVVLGGQKRRVIRIRRDKAEAFLGESLPGPYSAAGTGRTAS